MARKPSDRSLKRQIHIFCEGERDKSEYRYLKDVLLNKGLNTRNGRVEFAKKNTPKELVKEARKHKNTHKHLQYLEVWVVFDRDRHPELPETFQKAEKAGLHVAFSAVCFEYWILLHFEYTTAPFEHCETCEERVIKHISQYSKSYANLYEDTKENLDIAKERAKQLRSYQESANPGKKRREINPWTDIDLLVESIEQAVAHNSQP